jgi:CheY-like chemotaxis protein
MQSRILIADDHARARSGIADLIHGAGEDWVVCCEAADGQAAVECAAQTSPDLVILDVRMPKMDGMRAAREIRTLFPSVPILFYTLLATPALELAALAAGFNGVIAKPDSAALLAAIRRCLVSHKAGGGMPPSSETSGAESSRAEPC